MRQPPISLERYRKCVRDVFEVLSAADDGMTLWEVQKRLPEYPRSTVQIAVEDSLLFYVDRWTISRTNKVPCRVWMAVEFDRPEDCPRPDDRAIESVHGEKPRDAHSSEPGTAGGRRAS